MASISSNEIPEEYRFMGEFFNLRKKYYTPEDNDEYWEQLILESNELAKKYNTNYFTELILCMVDDIEKRFRGKPKKGFNSLIKRLRGDES